MRGFVVYGPPGTGKTRELIRLANWHVSKGQSVTFVSFTNAAANEAAMRVEGNYLEDSGEGGVYPSTLHSLAFRALKLSRDQTVDRRKLAALSDVTGIVFKRFGDDDNEEGDDFLATITYANNRLIGIEEAYEAQGRPGTYQKFMDFVAAYAKWKATYGYVDFDDMLIRAIDKVELSLPVLMVDEAQDCSKLQWALISKLIKGKRAVYIAGDDDQSIFEWSGADPHGMARFADEQKAETKVLTQSHRIPRNVHEFVHEKILAHIQTRVAKEFKPLDKNGRLIRYGSMDDAHEVELQNPLDPVMVLVRDRFRAMEASKALNRMGTPYEFINGQSPWMLEWTKCARGIRKIQEGGQPSKDEVKALASKMPDRSPGSIVGVSWTKLLPDMPYHMKLWINENYDKLLDPIMVRLSTIHQAKGKESDTVIVDLELTDRVKQQSFINPDAELRVMYVALTRVQNTLILCNSNHLI